MKGVCCDRTFTMTSIDSAAVAKKLAMITGAILVSTTASHATALVLGQGTTTVAMWACAASHPSQWYSGVVSRMQQCSQAFFALRQGSSKGKGTAAV